MTNCSLAEACLGEQGHYWATTNQENDVWIKVNTPKAFLLNQRDLRERMLIPTSEGKKIAPFVLQLANNNLDNWKQMFLLLSYEFHSSLPNAVPCRVEKNQIKWIWGTHQPRILEFTALGVQGCVLGSSTSNLCSVAGKQSYFLEYHFIDITQRILSGNCFWSPHRFPGEMGKYGEFAPSEEWSQLSAKTLLWAGEDVPLLKELSSERLEEVGLRSGRDKKTGL